MVLQRMAHLASSEELVPVVLLKGRQWVGGEEGNRDKLGQKE